MSELRDRVIAYNAEIKAALQTVLAELNQGQRKSCCAIPPSAQCLSGTGSRRTCNGLMRNVPDLGTERSDLMAFSKRPSRTVKPLSTLPPSTPFRMS